MKKGRVSKDEPHDHLSSAYIRSLVKQLTSSGCTKDPDPVDHAEGFNGQTLTKFSEKTQTRQPKPPPPPQQRHKKQARTRRRLQTSKPYQERLFNMAEARREIVTALKSHRAAMKQANEQQQQQQQQFSSQPLSHPSFPVPPFEFEHESKTNNLSTCHLDVFSNNWHADTLNCTGLPNQTIGLNLNFHGLNNIETKLHHNINKPPIYSSPSSSSSPSTLTEAHVPSIAMSVEAGPRTKADSNESHGRGGFHQASYDEKMADQMRSLEFPAWLNANDSVLLQQQQHSDDHIWTYHGYFHDDSALPSMDIGENEGIDGDWQWLAN